MLLAKREATLATNEAQVNMEIRQEVQAEQNMEEEIRAVSALDLKVRRDCRHEALEQLLRQDKETRGLLMEQKKKELQEKAARMKAARKKARADRRARMQKERLAKKR